LKYRRCELWNQVGNESGRCAREIGGHNHEEFEL
jgi:hypothetical protein